MSTHGPDPVRPTLVIGLGSPDRGDDAVGMHVARALSALEDARVVVLAHEDPTDLLELWSGYDRVVVVDATHSAAEPGTVRLLETGADRDPLPEDAWARTARGGTHAFGLAAAVELARVLHRLPRRVVVVGVEGASFGAGAPLSPRVEAAVPDAVHAVLGAVAGAATPVHTERRNAHVPG